MVNAQQPPERQRETDAAALAESAKHMESSAGAVKKSAHELTDSADRRTELAADRTLLAAERTYAAWVRTGLASLASGVGAQALLGDVLTAWLVAATGSVLILFSAFCFVAGVWRQFRISDAPPAPDTTRIPPVLFILVNGFLIIVSLAALVGIWSGVMAKH